MVRTQIRLDASEYERVKEQSRLLGISIAEWFAVRSATHFPAAKEARGCASPVWLRLAIQGRAKQLTMSFTTRRLSVTQTRATGSWGFLGRKLLL